VVSGNKVAIVGVGLLLAACSSSGKPGPGAGAGGGGAAAGVAGSGGVGGAGVAGGGGDGRVGGSGGADAGLTDAATGGAGGAATMAAEVCRAVLDALCDRVATCSGIASPAPANRAPPCDDLAAACPDYFFNASSTRTVASIAGCLADVQKLSCTDLDLSVRPPCWSAGTLPGGAPCARASNCQSSVCSGLNSTCGSCRGNAIALGDPCVGSSLCPGGSFCHPTTKVCTPVTTIVHAGVGATCDATAVPAIGCAGDLRCVSPDGGSAGTCEAPPQATVADFGQPCGAYHVCGPGLTCLTTFNGTGDAGATTSMCVWIEPCGNSGCDPTTFCKTGDGGVSCVPKAGAGVPCRGDGGRRLAVCQDDFYCSAMTGVCTAYAKEGESCAPNGFCASSLLCLGGRCLPLSTATCSSTITDGGSG